MAGVLNEEFTQPQTALHRMKEPTEIPESPGMDPVTQTKSAQGTALADHTGTSDQGASAAPGQGAATPSDQRIDPPLEQGVAASLSEGTDPPSEQGATFLPDEEMDPPLEQGAAFLILPAQ